MCKVNVKVLTLIYAGNLIYAVKAKIVTNL